MRCDEVRTEGNGRGENRREGIKSIEKRHVGSMIVFRVSVFCSTSLLIDQPLEMRAREVQTYSSRCFTWKAKDNGTRIKQKIKIQQPQH
eukprot:753523-Hanusia_phi.AAC.8